MGCSRLKTTWLATVAHAVAVDDKRDCRLLSSPSDSSRARVAWCVANFPGSAASAVPLLVLCPLRHCPPSHFCFLVSRYFQTHVRVGRARCSPPVSYVDFHRGEASTQLHHSLGTHDDWYGSVEQHRHYIRKPCHTVDVAMLLNLSSVAVSSFTPHCLAALGGCVW